jgi:hypothetical protein
MRAKGPIAWAALDTLSCLLLVVYVLIAPPSPQAPTRIDTYGEYAVTLSWPDQSPDDLDLFVQAPDGTVVYFANRSAAGMHLEHDDLGTANDPGVRQNAERVVIRAALPGEYVANVLYYQRYAYREQPVPVQVTLWRLRGQDRRLVERRLVLARMRDERTAFRFRLDAKGELAATSTLPKRLAG